jgi:threonine synthase
MLSVYEREGYLLCPHSAVGYAGWLRATQARPELAEGLGVTLATAHPAKFTDVVCEATGHTPEVPPQLQGYLEKIKHSIEIEATYTALRRHLIKTAQ